MVRHMVTVVSLSPKPVAHPVHEGGVRVMGHVCIVYGVFLFQLLTSVKWWISS